MNLEALASEGFDSHVTEFVLIHEVGHAMGLDHAPATDQVMTAGDKGPDVRARPIEFQAGDLRGLQRVGNPAGCDINSQASFHAALARLAAGSLFGAHPPVWSQQIG